jgi:16S rRNA U516 pseudouridylate synthase RsuA-like enzyme
MTAFVELFTLRLVRIAIGPILLDDLQAGDFRELSAQELRSLLKV